jgi:hypothetical protein
VTKLVEKIESLIRKGFSKLSERESNKWIRWLVNGLLSVIIVWFFIGFYRTQYQNILDYHLIFDFRFLVLGLLLFGINLILFGLAWHLQLNEFRPSKFALIFKLFMQAEVVKILPTPFWYLTKRMIGYSEQGFSKRNIALASLLEMFLHILVGLGILGTLLLDFSNPVSILYLLFALPLLLVIFFPELISFVYPSGKGSPSRGKLLLIIVLYFLTWIIGLYYFYAILRGCGIQLPVPSQRIWIIWIMSSLVSYAATFILGGIGILREFSLTLLLKPFIPFPVALLLSAVSRLIFIVGDLLWPLLAILILKNISSKTTIEQIDKTRG